MQGIKNIHTYAEDTHTYSHVHLYVNVWCITSIMYLVTCKHKGKQRKQNKSAKIGALNGKQIYTFAVCWTSLTFSLFIFTHAHICDIQLCIYQIRVHCVTHLHFFKIKIEKTSLYSLFCILYICLRNALGVM